MCIVRQIFSMDLRNMIFFRTWQLECFFFHLHLNNIGTDTSDFLYKYFIAGTKGTKLLINC